MNSIFSFRISPMLRLLLERVSRNRVYRRSLPERFGKVPLYVSPDAALKYLNPSSQAFDKKLLEVAAEYITERSIVWDIGSNVGLFSFACAAIAKEGDVLSIEPDLFLASLIRRSLRLRQNRRLKMSVLPVAISEKGGVSHFMIAERGRASNFLESVGGRTEAQGVREKALVPTISLDDLLQHFEPPTFVKVDVEGAEAKVLRGAQRLLEEFRPILFVEVGPESRSEVGTILELHRYKLFDGSRPFFERQPLQSPAWNTLAIPS